MGVSFRELRKVCQLPVAVGNDVAGLLYGDKASLPFTKLFVDLNLSPSIATVGMLVCGLAGSAMQFGAAGLAAAGAVVLLLYYVLDCVDGEVARWRQIEHARWGYYEYIFHFIVKPVAFLAIGLATYLQLGGGHFVVAGVLAAVATLWLKLFLAVPSIVFAGTVLKTRQPNPRPFQAYLAEAGAQAQREALATGEGDEDVEPVRLTLDRVTMRALATNFDVGLAALVLATLLDLAIGAFTVGGVTLSFRGLWVLYYGLVLPLDFLDYVRSFFVRRQFDRDMVRLLARAHGFVIPVPREATAPRSESRTPEHSA